MGKRDHEKGRPVEVKLTTTRQHQRQISGQGLEETQEVSGISKGARGKRRKIFQDGTAKSIMYIPFSR